MLFSARFDALILDGRSIAAPMLELFEGHQPDMPSITAAQDAPVSPELRKADAQYWTHKLVGLDVAPGCHGSSHWIRSLPPVTSDRA